DFVGDALVRLAGELAALDGAHQHAHRALVVEIGRRLDGDDQVVAAGCAQRERRDRKLAAHGSPRELLNSVHGRSATGSPCTTKRSATARWRNASGMIHATTSSAARARSSSR